jgi:hypothetical protein
MGEREISLGDFVKKLTVLMGENRVVMLFKEERPWHVLFYRLKKDKTAGKPSFFNTLRFDWDGPYPKCQQLSEFIQALHWTGAVGAVNPSYEKIVLREEMGQLWSKEITVPAKVESFLKHAASLAKEEFPREPSTMAKC